MEGEPVTYDLAFYQRLREEYEARWGESGFDELRLLTNDAGVRGGGCFATGPT